MSLTSIECLRLGGCQTSVSGPDGVARKTRSGLLGGKHSIRGGSDDVELGAGLAGEPFDIEAADIDGRRVSHHEVA